MSWLILALAPSRWGEARVGAQLAGRLVGRGDRVVFVAHPQVAEGLAGAPFEVVPTDARGDAFAAGIRRLVDAVRPRAIVLADLLTNVGALVERDAQTALGALGAPIVGVDTWHLRELDGVLDRTPDDALTVAPHLVDHPLRLVPVPFARPDAPGAMRVLPERQVFSAAERAAVRARHGLPGGPLVCVATEPWQHEDPGDPASRRLQAVLPHALGRALGLLRVPVLHLGPVPLEIPGVEVHHRPADAALLRTADLLLEANAAAEAPAIAAAGGVPVITVVHTGAPDELLAWPYQAWPWGRARALRTLLDRNPWSRVLNRHEITDLEGLASAIESVLPGGWAHEGAREASARVLDLLEQVPQPEHALDALLG